MPRIKINNRDCIEVSRGANLGIELAKHGFLHLPCGGKGLCRKCIVRVYGETSPLTVLEKLSGIEPPYRLACQVRVLGDIEVFIDRIPENRRNRKYSSIDIEIKPLRTSISIVEPPIDRLLKVQFDPLNCSYIDLHDRVSLVVFRDQEIIGLSLKNCSSRYILLVDIGTSNISYRIIDFSGRIVTEGVDRNPQISFGFDVITRIEKVLFEKDVDIKKHLYTVLRNYIYDLMKSYSCIVAAFVAGNSVMTSFLLGLSLESLASKPFKPLIKGLAVIRDPMCRPIIVLPVINGFVGSDMIANIVLTEYLGVPTPYMVFDIGTNTEIALVKSRDPLSIIVTSTPAGSALEESAHIDLEGISEIEFIGFENNYAKFRAKGVGALRGSAIVNLIAELIRYGLVDQYGRFLKGYIVKNNTKYFVVDEEKNVLFSQHDLREAQKAIAAIKSAWKFLLDIEGLRVEDLKAVVISGYFGYRIRLEDAIELNLIPSIPIERILRIGNGVIPGLQVIALNRDYLELAFKIAEQAKYVNLAMHSQYTEYWIKALKLKEF